MASMLIAKGMGTPDAGRRLEATNSTISIVPTGVGATGPEACSRPWLEEGAMTNTSTLAT